MMRSSRRLLDGAKRPKVSRIGQLGSLPSLTRKISTTTSADFALTTLPNGVRVTTNPIPGHFSAMGLYIHAGSRFESEKFSGVSHIIDRLAFKSTTSRSSQQMEEHLQELGGNYMCASSRETLMYQASVFHDHSDQMFEALADTVKNPLITDEEVAQQLDTAAYEIYEIWQKPELILPEVAHMTAFKGGLGNPLLCPEDRLSVIDAKLIREYRDTFYQPDRIVASFVGVPHEKAVELATKHLGDLKSNPKAASSIDNQPSIYTGGEQILPLPEPIGNLPQFYQLHVLYRGVSIADDDVYALACLQTLLGGGGSFSAGGPGKGMYSRLYTDVLNCYGYIESCLGINHSYSDDGLFGISASCIPNAAPYLSQVIGLQLSLLMTKGQGALNYTEVERAKKQLRSSVLMNLESKMVELEDLGRQIQLNNKKVPVAEMVEKIDALTAEDLRRVAERVLTSSPPTLVMQGASREAFGDVQDTLKRYGLGGEIKETEPAKTSWWKR
ncbi:Mas2p [Sugiyamaella lignohabitans]|uniref:Alpha-MPP n=1 Tax=Sugiyamaella lignohabitans TaxID=796027 RepID=A0A167F617_9ASCO|nr:Mas2p [Sugiyamaella lignohabitans]ANB14879.1 Mas2p [Sugiyamaella lignohabitans]